MQCQNRTRVDPCSAKCDKGLAVQCSMEKRLIHAVLNMIMIGPSSVAWDKGGYMQCVM